MKQLIKPLLIQYRSKIIKSLLIVSPILLFYLLFVNVVKIHECSLNYNFISGKIVVDTIPGIKINSPWVLVSNIDTRPIRVCVDCSCNNISCKLVSFNPHHYQDFIEKEGWSYYWWRNRVSFNSGNNREWRGMDNIIRGYAFDNKSYKFIKQENKGI